MNKLFLIGNELNSHDFENVSSMISFLVQNAHQGPYRMSARCVDSPVSGGIAGQQVRLDVLKAALDAEQARIDEYRRVRREDVFYDLKIEVMDHIAHETNVKALEKDYADMLKLKEEEKQRGFVAIQEYVKALFAGVHEKKSVASLPNLRFREIFQESYNEQHVDAYVAKFIPFVDWMQSEEIMSAIRCRVVAAKQENENVHAKARAVCVQVYDNLEMSIAREQPHVRPGDRNILSVMRQIWDTLERESDVWYDFGFFARSFVESVEYMAPEGKFLCWRRFGAYLDDHHAGNEKIFNIFSKKE